jgi:hypothetical protein
MQGSTQSFLVQHTRLSGKHGAIGVPVAHATSCQRAQPRVSRRLAGSRRRLARSAWLFPCCCGSLSRFVCGINRRWQFQLGLFRSAMVAVAHQVDARSFFSHPQLSVSTFSALVLKVFRNRFSWHGRSVAELSPSKLCNFAHSVTIYVSRRRGGGLGRERHRQEVGWWKWVVPWFRGQVRSDWPGWFSGMIVCGRACSSSVL